MLNRLAYTAATLSVCCLLAPGPALAQSRNVTSEGFEDLRYGQTFYIQVPMIDEPAPVTSLTNPEPSHGGIGDNITAESIINNVRYAGEHPDINHVVFLMRTGGGSGFHADAMLEVIEEHHDNTEFHIIIDHAISAGVWTVMSCDNIFMVDGGTVGGAVGYVTLPDGSPLVVPNLGILAAQIGQTAERNGHSSLLLPAMIHQPAELHYWEVNGEGVLSDEAPDSPSSVENYELIDSELDVLTLTTNQAETIGLAKRIESLDAQRIGDHIGTPGWTRANHYGHVVHEIASIYDITRPDQDSFENRLAGIPFFRDTRLNRSIPEVLEILRQRDTFGKLLSGYTQINEALNNLPYVHPERHIYFEDENGRTVLADPQQWASDVRASRAYTQSFSTALRDIRTALRRLEMDTDNISDLEEALEHITGRIEGIARRGNAAYWAENAVSYTID